MFKNLNRFHKEQRGITGLETAIILIAFVVVASVFAYTVLSAGIFSSQKGKEAVNSGLQQARGTMEPKGEMIAKSANGATINQLIFTVVGVGGEPIDMTAPTDANANGLADSGSSNTTVISYVDKNQRINDLAWSAIWLAKSNGDSILDSNEAVQVTVDLTALNPTLATYTSFSLEVKPANGAVLVMERTTPAKIDSVLALR